MPTTPAASPTLIEQTDKTLKINMPFIATAQSGDSPIVSYNLEIDDGNGGDFKSLTGYSPTSMLRDFVVTNVTRSSTYRLRYRVLNAVEWSNYSANLNALVATVPSAPPLPTLGSATGSTITITFKESADSGGSKITSYELWRDQGTLGSTPI